MANYVVSDASLTAIADAIREKGETTDPLTFPDGFATAIAKIKTGGSASVAKKDVNFYDYDGTRVKAYTAAEFAALSAMPDNPDHTEDDVPLTAQGWNWSLANAQAYVAKYGRLNVGQMYVTTDGKTHILIHIAADTPANRLTFYLRWTQTVSNGVTVDWGDGSAPETFSGTSAANHAHTYAAGGDYHITLDVTSGTMLFEGNSSNSVFGASGNANSYNRGRIRAIWFGANMTGIGDRVFYNCMAISTITIPYGVESIGSYAICYGHSLTAITIPDGVRSIGGNAFNNCDGLIVITIPESVASIGVSAFQSCIALTDLTIPDSVARITGYAVSYLRSLTTLTIPESVATIESSAFQNNYSISEYHIRPTTPPTLSSTNAFSDIASDCVMYVPYSEDHSILEAYKTASNWSTYASRMQEEPQA